jgi:hypothetical protein
MKAPSDAQAKLLQLIEHVDRRGESVEWQANDDGYDRTKPSRARLRIEQVDREADRARFVPADEGRLEHRVATVKACIRHGWLSDLHQRSVHFAPNRYRRRPMDWELHQLDLTEDGVIALGLWRERKLKAPPAPLPILSDREREVIALSRRALELGYALAPREPVRKEARKLRKDGWFDRGCWIANSVAGLVPSATAISEVIPEYADKPIPPYPGQRAYARVELHLGALQ